MFKTDRVPRFELGGYWLGREGTSKTLYRYWYDDKGQRVNRRSLGTSNIEEAKNKLARLILDRPTDNGLTSEYPLITTLLNHYWGTHSDSSPSAFQARRAGTLLMEWLTDVRKKPAANATEFTLPWQQDFVKWLGQEKNHAVSTIAREMTSLAAAFNHALKPRVVVDEKGEKREVQLLNVAVPVLYKVGEISRLTAKPEPMPRDWLPTWAQLALFIDTIGTKTSTGAWDKNSENLFRYVVCALNTWARPAAILGLHVPTQVDFEAGSIRLNPPGRKQTKKVRPTIPLTANLAAWLKHWNCDRPVHRNGTALKSVKKAFKAHALKLGMPKLTPYTLRHFMATNIRRINGCQVTREQRQEWLGHKPQDITAWYEHFDLEWLREARLGTDRIMDKLDKLLKTQSFVRLFLHVFRKGRLTNELEQNNAPSPERLVDDKEFKVLRLVPPSSPARVAGNPGAVN